MKDRISHNEAENATAEGLAADCNIPKPLEDACLRTLEELMIKAPHFMKGYSGESAPAFSSKLHVASLKKEAAKNMFCSDVPAGLRLQGE